MRRPDLKGPAARAWRLASPAYPACLAAYLVDRPGAHPLWHVYVVAVAHLRPVDGLPPAKLRFPEATHELSILSLNPEDMPEPEPDRDSSTFLHLLPPDLSWQGALTDDEAERLVMDAVTLICADRKISPDSDFREWWERALPKTLEHYRTGGHR